MKTIGCIGLGLLGSAIARRLLQGGYRIGVDIDAARVADLAGSASRSPRRRPRWWRSATW
ncbi:MAG: hypothetical protein R3E68_13870 [Burkholderiaceae bacterium]